MDIKEYVEEYEKIVRILAEGGYPISFDLALTILKERGKDRRMDEIAEQRQAKLAEPITDKQKKYIIDLCTRNMEPLPNLSGMSKEDAGKIMFDLKKKGLYGKDDY